MEPGRAAAAVFVGLTLGIVPVYGLQSILALGIASLFRLNRALTFAATFINNPLLQPILLAGSLQLGHRVTQGAWLPLTIAALQQTGLAASIASLAIGSLLLSILIGIPAAGAAYLIVASRSPHGQHLRAFRRFLDERYAAVRRRDRGFIRWKARLDRVFGILMDTDLGSGPVVDLGCGYGMMLALVAFKDPTRPLRGCDLDARRVRAAHGALEGYDSNVELADARRFEVSGAGLILLIDVLQYLSLEDQQALLARCVAALRPGGILIIREPDTSAGWRWWMTQALDLVAVKLHRAASRPSYQHADTLAATLAAAGLAVEARSYRNVLPLAHVVVRATQPGAPSRS